MGVMQVARAALGWLVFGLSMPFCGFTEKIFLFFYFFLKSWWFIAVFIAAFVARFIPDLDKNFVDNVPIIPYMAII
jgi:hypothetical protein